MFPTFAFEHADGLSGARIEYLTSESRQRLTAVAGALGIHHLKRIGPLVVDVSIEIDGSGLGQFHHDERAHRLADQAGLERRSHCGRLGPRGKRAEAACPHHLEVIDHAHGLRAFPGMPVRHRKHHLPHQLIESAAHVPNS